MLSDSNDNIAIPPQQYKNKKSFNNKNKLFQSAIRLNENITKVSQLKDDQEECETKLEKERDIYASNMFDLLAEEDNISSYILNYVKCMSIINCVI